MNTFRARRLQHFDYRGRYRYFITICTHHNLPLLVAEDILTFLTAELKDRSQAFGFKIWIYCFMPNHLHLLLEGNNDDSDLRKFIAAFKQTTGYFYSIAEKRQGAETVSKRKESLWQPSYYDHIVRNDEATMEILRYIANNPVRKGLVQNFLDYPYTGSFVVDLRDL